MIGRILGWMFVAVAILTASADVVMALGSAPHDGLMAAEVWTLISGRAPDFETAAPGMEGLLAAAAERTLAMPAWVVLGPLGLAMLAAFRRRRHRTLFRHPRTIG